MKKIIIGILVVIVVAMFKDVSESEKIIPDEAIRFRILANSNSEYDQQMKEKVSEGLQSDMYSLLSNVTNINDARNIIKSNINKFSKKIGNILKDSNYNLSYAIDFGSHYFPKKLYKGITYDAGSYESLLVKLGEGEGNNWWCVLFPPLCLLEAKESTSNVEYKFFVQEIIDKFF